MILLYKLHRDKGICIGLVFDSQLSWDLQISNVCKKMSYLIKLHSEVLNHHIMKLLICSLVFSHLTYPLSACLGNVNQATFGSKIGSISKLGCETIVQFPTCGPCYRILSLWRVVTFSMAGDVSFPIICLMFHQYHCDYGRGIPLEPSLSQELKALSHILSGVTYHSPSTHLDTK